MECPSQREEKSEWVLNHHHQMHAILKRVAQWFSTFSKIQRMKPNFFKHWKDQGDLLNTEFIQHGTVCRKRCRISTLVIPEERHSQQGLPRARAGGACSWPGRPDHSKLWLGQHQATTGTSWRAGISSALEPGKPKGACLFICTRGQQGWFWSFLCLG